LSTGKRPLPSIGSVSFGAPQALDQNKICALQQRAVPRSMQKIAFEKIKRHRDVSGMVQIQRLDASLELDKCHRNNSNRGESKGRPHENAVWIMASRRIQGGD
jgi:hypothetical protein